MKWSEKCVKNGKKDLEKKNEVKKKEVKQDDPNAKGGPSK